jgi:hypothetical protein
MTFDTLAHPRADIGTFTNKVQTSPDVRVLSDTATTRAIETREGLAHLADLSNLEYSDLDNGFEQSFFGDEDAARTAALAYSEGVTGIVSPTGTDGQSDFHNIILGRVDEDGDEHHLEIPFTTGSGTKPTTAMVLSAVLTDSAGLNDVDSVDEWADSLGYDLGEDGPAVRAAYAAVLEQDGTVRSFLGERYENYLWGE